MLRKSAVIGKVFEIKTYRGLAYFQCTHHDETMGPLIRVLPGIYDTRPNDLALLVATPHQFVTFFAVRHHIKDGLVTLVGEYPIPPFAMEFPLMRVLGLPDPKTGKYTRCSFYNGIKKWRDDEACLKANHLPVEAIWTWKLLIDRIDEGWTLDRAEELRARAAARQLTAATEKHADGSDGEVQHYLYYPHQADADQVAKMLIKEGFQVEHRLGADGMNWLVLVKHRPETSDEMFRIRNLLNSLAQLQGGHYDGWQAAPRT